MTARIISTLAFLSLLGFIQAADPNCENITKPLELEDDYSSIMGKWIRIDSIANHHSFIKFFSTLSSSWLEFAPSPLRDTIIFSHGNKQNGTCQLETLNPTIKNSTMSANDTDGTYVSNFLPSCLNCLTFRLTSYIKNETITSLYLYSRSPKVPESEKHLYWKQAACLGFKRQTHFSYDGVTGFCKDDKLIPPTEQTKPEDKKEDRK